MPAEQIDLSALKSSLETIREEENLPALGAAIVTSKGLQAIATTGFRKRGAPTPVSDEDLWHLGSCGKAMTATVMARLVERGLVQWTQNLGETFPELRKKMSDDFASITLEQLLSHRSGLSANFDVRKYIDKNDLFEARRQTLLDAMARPLNSRPGRTHLYSNWGYTIASCMAEKLTDKAWERLVKEELFEPLEMKSAGFGGTGTIGVLDQPWPHFMQGKRAPSNGPAMDNVPTMSAAGRIHMTLQDWGKFVSEHLRGARGESTYLSKESFTKLHASVGDDDYALGWNNAERDWGGGTVWHHAGDNTMNFAILWAAPKKDFAVLVVTNQSNVHLSADFVVGALIQAWTAKIDDE